MQHEIDLCDATQHGEYIVLTCLRFIRSYKVVSTILIHNIVIVVTNVLIITEGVER